MAHTPHHATAWRSAARLLAAAARSGGVPHGSARSSVLLDLTGVWPTRAGAAMAINSGPRPRARRWSRAIYAAYPAAQGLYYASSMDGNAPAVALYERAAPAIPERPLFHRALADPLLLPSLAGAADELGYTLNARREA